MSLFSLMKRLFNAAPEEQVVGYSVPELKAIFGNVLTEEAGAPLNYPVFSLLAPAGVQAYYSSFIMDKTEVVDLQKQIYKRFSAVNERFFNGLTVTRFQHQLRSEHLIFSISYKEFNGATIRLITNSSEILSLLSEAKFAVPPPWVAFEGYEASWWGGDMQGAQGFYNDNYFFPFFSALSPAERNDYYARYSAPEDWISSLELTLDH